MKILQTITLLVALAFGAGAAHGQDGQGSGPMTIAKGGTSAITASAARTSLGVAIGSNVQAFDADLAALAGNSTAGFWAYTGAGTGAARILTAPAAGFTITNPAGTAGNPTFVLADDLGAVEGMSCNGLATRTTTNTWLCRAIVAPAAGFTFSNSDGQAGNPTAVLANDLAALEGLAGTGIARRTGTDTWTVGTNVSVAEGGTGATSITSMLDTAFSSTQGSVLYRNASAWVALAPGTAGQFLTTQGAAANPNWSSGGAGTGTVTSVTCGTGLTGGTFTAVGTCALDPAATLTSTAGGVGYATGAGGTVTQATSKSTGVTLNKLSGQITMNAASLAANDRVAFTLTNSTIAATDVIGINISSGTANNHYVVMVHAVAAGSCRVSLINTSGGAYAEALVLNFAVIKAANN